MGRVRSAFINDQVEFLISAPHTETMGIFLAIWVISVAMGAKTVLDLARGAEDRLDALGQIALLALVAYFLARQIFGREVVRVRGNTLTIRFETFGFGWDRTYALSDVHLIRVDQPWEYNLVWPEALRHTLSWEDWPYYRFRPVAPVIAFEYRGREHRFGLDLDRQSANDLVTQLRERVYRARASVHTGSIR